MPTLRAPSPSELNELSQQGVDVSKLPPQLLFDDPPQMSQLSAVGKTLKAHAGGYAGAGAGILGAEALPIAHIAPPYSEIGAGIVGGLVGGFGGQKIQESVEPEQWKQEAAEAAQQHPITTLATDIAANAITGGGKPSVGNILKAGRGLIGRELSSVDRAALSQVGEEALSPEGAKILANRVGDRNALINVGTQAVLNPAIASGISLATEGKLPGMTELVGQSLGGALFSEPNALGSMAHRIGTGETYTTEPQAEPTQKGGYQGEPKEISDQSTPSPFTTRDEAGKYVVDDIAVKNAFKELFPKPDTKGMSNVDKYIADSKWRNQTRVSIDDMRAKLHDNFIAQQAQATPVTEPTAKQSTPENATTEAQAPTPKPVVEQAPKPQLTPEQLLQNEVKVEKGTPQEIGFNPATNPTLAKQGWYNINTPAIKASIQVEPNKITLNGMEATEPGSGVGSRLIDRLKLLNKPIETIPKANTPELQPTLEKFYSRHGFQDKGDGAWEWRPLSKTQQFLGSDVKTTLENYGGRVSSPQNKFENGHYLYDSKLNKIVGPFGHSMAPKLRLELAGLSDRNSYPEYIDPLGFHNNINEFNESKQSKGNPKLISPDEAYPIKGYSKESLDEIYNWMDKTYGVKPEDLGRVNSPQTDVIRFKQLTDYFKQLVAKGDTSSNEFVKVWKELEDIKNRNKGLPPQLPEEKGARVSDVLGKIAESEHPLNETAKYLGSKLDSIVKDVHIVVDPNEEGGSFNWDGKDKIIKLNPRNANNIPVIMEEIAHAATVTKLPQEAHELKGYALKQYIDKYIANPKADPDVKEIFSIFKDVAKKLNIETELFALDTKAPEAGLAGHPEKAYQHFGTNASYYFSDLREFIAGVFSDRSFGKLLNDMPSGIEGKSMWSRLLDVIKKFLNLDPKAGSMLERLMKPVDSLIGKPTPEQVSSFKVGTRPRDNLESANAENKGGWIAQAFRSTIDKIRQIDHPAAKTLAEASQRMLDERQQLIGKWWNPLGQISKKITPLGDKRLEAASRYELENSKSGEHLLKTKDELTAFRLAKKFLLDNFNYRTENKEPVMRNGILTMPRRDEHYFPTTPSPKLIEDYKQGRLLTQHDKEFMDYQINKMGADPEEAQRRLEDFKTSVQGNISKSAGFGNMQEFQAARKAQGLPLPPEWTRPGFFKNLESYAHRMATDNTFYKHIESNPEIMSALGETKTPWGMPISKSDNVITGQTPVRALLNTMKGEMGGAGEHNEKALSSLATGMIIGPGTEVHKIISNLVGVTSIMDNPYQTTRYLASAITNYRDGLKHAIENGVVKFNARRLGDALDGNVAFADKLHSVAQIIKSAYTLGGLTEEFSAGTMQAGLEGVLPMKIAKANEGDITNQKLLRQLDPDYKVGKEYDSKGISELASKAINSIQGTGDARTMPPWMMKDSEISGFFKLSHWSVSQTNRFVKQIYEPATRGDFAPLITSLFGSAIGGYMIKDLREQLQGKKGQIPSLTEIAASDKGLSGNPKLLAYELMASSTYAGFGGMLSMLSKLPFDIAYKNSAQGMIFPLDEFASDIMGTIKNASTAIANDPNLSWSNLASQVTWHLLSSNFQLGRVVLNQAIDHGMIDGQVAEKKQLADKLNQLRRFEMVEGTPYNEIDSAGNPYMNLEAKKFHLEQNPVEAAKQVPGLVQNIMAAYHDNPDVMMSKIKALKQNQYATFPSLESMPLQFVHYLQYLAKTKGPEQAQAELVDYMKHEAINRAKAEVVP